MKTICFVISAALPNCFFADTGHQEVEHVDMDTVKVSGKAAGTKEYRAQSVLYNWNDGSSDWLAYFRQGYAAVGERNDASAAR